MSEALAAVVSSSSSQDSASSVFFLMFMIFTGSAFMATLALYARQAMLVGYIFIGIALGPWGLALMSEQDAPRIKDIAHIGIVFLLFLLGLNLKPGNLLHMLGKTTGLTLLSSLLFAVVGFLVGLAFGYNSLDSLIIGTAMMFSSTILGLKLLPTTVLHHKHAGEIIVSVLLLQDLLAILVLLMLKGGSSEHHLLTSILMSIFSLPLLIAFAWGFSRYVLLPLIQRFSKIQEYIFLTAIGWCLGLAALAEAFKLSHEIGAFIGGVVLATSPIALFIAESLKPLRDFFLVMFFFTLGAGLNLHSMPDIILPASCLAGLMLVLKPYVFRWLLVRFNEPPQLSLEMGYRLGQISEFSLLIAVLAWDLNIISDNASYLIQVATVLTFIVSSYLIVMRYPTPVAVSDALRRD